MIAEAEAREKILERVQPLPRRSVSLAGALDCFAAEDYFARIPLPAFDNSAMDGYAVIASSSASGKRLRVVAEQPAGLDQRVQVSAGEAVRIFTGAPIPAGADAVIMQEDVTRDGNNIRVNTKVEVGEFIRRCGCDLAVDQKILAAGDRVTPAVVALLASQGFTEISIGGEVNAAIISTGDELVRPGEPLQAGQIYDSNSVLLAALGQRSGAVLQSVEHCPDDHASLSEAFERTRQNQMLVISGGVSVGEHDLVQAVLRDLGAKIDIWRVAIKPGKPFLFGSLGECFIFGLPGNPVSAFVTFLRFVRPALLRMMGASDHYHDPPKITAELIVDLRNDGDRVHYIRGKFENGKFSPVGRQESHALFGLSQSNALLRVPIGAEFKQGSAVEIEVSDWG